MSTFSCPVVSFSLEKHPDADSLSIARVRGWTCVVRTQDFQNEEFGVYIPLDAVADITHPLLSFLKGKRVRTAKLRGIISQGVLLPYSVVKSFLKLESDISEGTDLSESLHIKKYVPRDIIEKYFHQNPDALPKDEIPEEFTKYTDIEKYNDYFDLMPLLESDLSLEELQHSWEPVVSFDGEEFSIERKYDLKDIVCITEKLHGTSARFGLIDGKFYIGSRNLTLRSNPATNSLWHTIFENEQLAKKLQIAEFCCQDIGYRGIVFYGEIVGKGIQDLHYGHETPTFYLYDIKVIWEDESFYLNHENCKCVARFDNMNLKCVPELYVGPFVNKCLDLRFGNDSISNSHIREGIVIKPIVERRCDQIGRVILKLHSEEYLLRKNPKDR